MKKLIASILKELQLLAHDKVGLLLLYLMPVVLVFIITVVQDSAFKLVNDNQLELLITNNDEGSLGDSLVGILKKSGSFLIDEKDELTEKKLQQEGLSGGKLASIYIPKNFTEAIENNTGAITKLILTEFGVSDDTSAVPTNKETSLNVYFDPILQENF